MQESARLNIRTALDHDAERIAALFVQLEYAATLAELSLRLPRLLRHPDIDVLVADRDGAVHGVLVLNMLHPLHVAQPWAVVSALVVEESMRGQGVGAALLDAAEQAARRRTCAHVELSCSLRRTGAHAFYEARGYAEVRKRYLKRCAAAVPDPAASA
jgi:GNAT superfamily N-acetyltransferase